MWGCLSWLYIIEFTQSRLWSLALWKANFVFTLRVQTSPVRFLEATNWYSPGDRTICIAVSCTPKFTMGIVFALLCLFSNMPFKLEEFNLRVNIAVKTYADRKYCGFILFFSFSDFQFSKSGPEKRIWVHVVYLGGNLRKHRKKIGKERQGRKANMEDVSEQVTLWAAETRACWGLS